MSTSQYIIDYVIGYDKKKEGFITINSDSSFHNFSIFDDLKNEIGIYNISFPNFDDENKTFYFLHKLKKIKIYFSNTGSDYLNFKSEFEQIKKSYFSTTFYPSDNIKYEGYFLDDLKHGKGILYYDSPKNKIKYKGEFENGNIDGSGIFYSKDGFIQIIINNISNNVPRGNIKLILKTKTPLETTIDLKNIHHKLDIFDDNFCLDIALQIYPTYAKIKYNSLSLEEKIKILEKRILCLEQKVKKNNNYNFFSKIIHYFFN